VSDDWRARYEAYIKSPEWRARRAQLFKVRLHKCERCGRMGPSIKLEVHHRTYERLERERDSDLEILCEECHGKADIERASAGRAKSAAALYDARLDGWASKRYGEDWADNYADIAEEFDDWCEGRDD
jgi:hypothetical protein